MVKNGTGVALWEWITFAYFMYLTVVAFAGRRFVRARRPALLAMSGCALIAAVGSYWPQPVAHALVPIPILLAGYWLSGFFFVQPMHRAERWLLHVDTWLLGRSALVGRPRFVDEYLELAYALVYAVVPAGALTLALGGDAAAVSRFWAIVLLAEFVSYGMLPWLQTRPPRALECEVGAGAGRSVMRRLNLIVLNRGSIQVNTIPSGHAAGAVAVALAVGASMPIVGAAFLILAASIVTATVVCRYHYFVDSVLGVLVALGAWYLLR